MREIATLVGRSLSTISRGESRIRVEYCFDGQAEDSRNDEGQGEARVEPARLDRIDGLPRDLRRVCQLCLGPIPFGPEHTNPVLHPPNRRIPMSTDSM